MKPGIRIFLLLSVLTGLLIQPIAAAPLGDRSTVGPQPILTWPVVPNAVYYEIEFLDRLPENPNGTSPSAHRRFASRAVFTNGYNPDLRDLDDAVVYWRVLGLDIRGNPIGTFSDARRLRIDAEKKEPLKPLITSRLNARGSAPLLYPVYTWIPLLETTTYELELTRLPPENPGGVEPSQYRIWSTQAEGFACYDEQPRRETGRYYYRVRGITPEGAPVGVWSDAAVYEVFPTPSVYAATLGDSITHGGGAISYSPADWAYDYQTYLKFSTLNLGRSGDTSETTAARFDEDVLPFRPRYLLIMTGINSIRAGVPAESVIRDLRIIRYKCLLQGIRPILLTLPPINPAAIARAFGQETSPDWQQELSKVNDFIRRQTYYVDLYPHFADERGELPERLAIDGLHYDIAGKQLMALIINAEWDRVTR